MVLLHIAYVVLQKFLRCQSSMLLLNKAGDSLDLLGDLGLALLDPGHLQVQVCRHVLGPMAVEAEQLR